MAQAFFEHLGPPDMRAESAGAQPASAVWPGVVEAMREAGLDIAGRKPKKLMREMQLHADWAVTMGCGDACPYVSTSVEDWDVPDPAGRPIEEVRAIRDDIERRVRELIATKLDAIRSDRTAHELRLEQLLPQLAREFEGHRSPGEIRACAGAVLSGFDGAYSALLRASARIPANTRMSARRALRGPASRMTMARPAEPSFHRVQCWPAMIQEQATG